jgi:hypothetical protein
MIGRQKDEGRRQKFFKSYFCFLLSAFCLLLLDDALKL